MKKIAIFGKPGGGKSTLGKQFSIETGIDLYPLDSIEYNKDGNRVDDEIYKEHHNKIIASDSWIIDGLGTIESFNSRLEAADTLIYIDLPYYIHYWWVTKRFIQGIFKTPEGWPKNCSIFKGTKQSYKVLKICPKFWNDALLNQLKSLTNDKSLYVIKTPQELNSFINKTLNISKK